MTDSMKFGPEWLRNMSNDMNAAGGGGGGGGGGSSGTNSSSSTNNNSTSGGNSTTAPLGPRYQLAEYRYGREEMLSLFDKNLKTPEILPTFKTLYVEKVQCPLALTPSTEDEIVNSTRPWGLRSPVSFAVSTRGTGRGGSVDRGRGRTRAALYHAIIGYQRPTALYDEDIRGLGRGERSWPERNGGNEITGGGGGAGGAGGGIGGGGGGSGSSTGSTIDWNGSPSSSPRKEYNSSAHSRSNLENWRRSRTEDDVGDGWRGAIGSSSSGGGTGSAYRWSRSTSWRDEDTSNNASSGGGNGSGEQISSQITRSFSTSAAPTITRTNSASGPSGFKVTSGGNDDSRPNGKGNSGVHQWEQDDLLPEWAMENPTDSGGSFDASGAFHGSNEANDEDSEKLGNKSTNDGENRKKSKSELPPEHETAANNSSNKTAPTNRRESDDQKQEKSTAQNDIQHEVGGMLNHSAENGEDLIKSRDQEIKLPEKILSSVSECNQQNQPKKPTVQQSQPQQQPQPQPQSSGGVGISLKSHPPPISEISDRMQEVADDMVEKLIMDDEMTMITTTTMPKKTSSSGPSMMKGGSTVTSNSPTAPTLIQQPLINSHPLISQPPPPPPSEMWYYRDPQGKVQGPFSATEMAEWYRAGYFDENLYVRRVCDSRFSALGELVKMCGNSMPFLSSHLIPPLIDMSVPPVVPHMTQTSQPPPPQGVGLGGKPNVTPILGTSDVMSLNIQLQFLQKQFLMRQQSLILSKLSTTEPWSLLNPDQQQQLLNQQMAQVVLPDHLMSLSALSNSLSIMNPSAFALQQMLNTAKNDMNPKKSGPPPLHNPHNPFGNDFVGAQSALHNIMQGNLPPQGGSMGQQPGAPQSNGPTIENDPIKSFIMQFHMQGKVPVTGPPMSSKWPTNITPQQAWPGGTNSATGTPVSMWDFGPMVQPKPEMKTEQEILEEQLLKEKQTRQQAEMAAVSLVGGDRTENAPEEVLQKQVPQQQPPPPPVAVSQQVPHSHPGIQQVPQNSNAQQIQSQQQQQQPAPPPPPPQHQIQSQQSASKKETEKMKQQSVDEKPQKVAKHEEEQKRPKGGKGDKKENKKAISEEERKKEANEEKKRLKEERKRQQIEEEKKRQQQQEEEKRRQMLEEKKRLEEIDQHRRAKMLENAPPKPAKTTSAFERNISASSVAPWINTGLTGITTPGPNFAEIQKAERERRAEEQRLEQIMESQRKSQMELLAQKENVLMWNAQPLKSVNVKSLAEIQAEEAKRLASEQAAAASLEQRKKEEAAAAAAAAAAATASLQSSSYGNNAFGSIWNSRSAQNMVWNGKTAWSTTSSTSGFWEEPTKQSSAASASKQATNARILSKSQTISNIQTVKKENTGSKQIQQSIGLPVAAVTVAAAAPKPAKGGKKKEAVAASGLSGQMNSTAKKDDARNEFTSWCIKTLSSMNSTVDVPIFIAFLQDIESPFEVKDYIRVYLGETKECTEFAKQFLERRSKYKNQQRAQNAHIDDMCSPAPAINPASDFQEVKGKGKKVKKNKMTKLDARILGFSVTAAQDRINVGDRDYGDAS